MSDGGREPLNLERLREASMGDTEFEQILLAAFLEEAAAQVAEIMNAATSGTLEDLSRAAHNLKGASANVGANEVRNICVILERMDPESDRDGASILASDLKAELGRVSEFINAMGQ